MKLLCTGDLHLGAGADLGRAPGDRLRDQADVLGRIAGIAVERGVDAILIAGDVFEGPGIPPEQLDLFARFVDACRTVDIPVVAITGNGKHDAAMRDTNGLAIFSHIPGIRVSSTPELIDVAGVQVCTLPWTHPGRLIAAHGRDVSRDETNSVVAELLLEAARGLRAQTESGSGPAILLLHWSVSGSALPNGLPVDDLREPVLDVDALEQLGFDAVVCGHIHKPQLFGILGQSVFYVGSPLPLNFGEAHDEHGVWIIDDGVFEFVPVESRPLVTLDFDITADEFNDLHDDVDDTMRIPDGAIVRLRYTATADQQRRIDTSALRRLLADAGAHTLKIVPDIVRADRARVEGLDDGVDELEALDRWLDATDYVGDRERLRSRAALYLEAVPS